MATAETSTIVVLTDEEWAAAVGMGRRRHEAAERRGYRQTDGSKSKNGLMNHVYGAGGEIACARYYDLPWDATINVFRRIPDMVCCEVRSAKWSDDPERQVLRVKRGDSPAKKGWVFIAVSRRGERKYQIEGWMYGYEAMIQKHFKPCCIQNGNPEWQPAYSDPDMHPPFALYESLQKLRDLYARGAA
jgi:hypothetical protein